MFERHDAPLPAYGSLDAAAYAELGLRVGLEIHQQLATRRKLFCRCPAGLYSHQHDAEILRHMRPTLSELGEYDGTALMEFKKRKEILYLLDRRSVCTYEMDDAPPFEIDPVAVRQALRLALLLDLNLVSELHIARKQYLDGSIPAGFQRTTLLGIDGSVPFAGRRLGILQLGLEEDSSREVSDRGHTITFRTDRLGMPLVEMVTAPELHTPQEAVAAAELLRRLARSTGEVRRGAGAARQDVNVSIRGGTRIEIKGVPSIRRIGALVHGEALRQAALLRLRDELRRRGVDGSQPAGLHRDVTRLLGRALYLPLSQALEAGQVARAVVLRHFAGLLAWPTQEGIAFAQEFSERVRVIACLEGYPNLIHSDSLEPTLSNSYWKRLRRALGASDADTVVVVWGPERDAILAADEVLLRALDAARGVPSETRQARADGSTGFERILPGPQRMYPDTDLPPCALDDAEIDELARSLPPTPWARRERYEGMGLPRQTVERMLLRPELAERFEDLLRAVPDAAPVLAATLLVERLEGYARRGRRLPQLAGGGLATLLRAVTQGQVGAQGLPRILRELSAAPDRSLSQVLRGYGVLESEAREAALEGLAPQLPFWLAGARSPEVAALQRLLMARAMNELAGRVEAQAVATRIAALLERAGIGRAPEEGGRA